MWAELRETLSPHLSWEDAATAEQIDDLENSILEDILDTLFGQEDDNPGQL